VQLDRTRGDFTYARQLTPELPDAPYYDFTRENADAKRGSLLVRVAQRLSPELELDVLGQGTVGDRGVPGSWTELTSTARAQDRGGLLGARLRGIAADVGWSVRAWGRADRIELTNLQAFGSCSTCPPLLQNTGADQLEGELVAPLGTRQTLRAFASAGGESIRGSSTGNHGRARFAVSAADDLRLNETVSLHPAVRFDDAGQFQGVSPGVSALWRSSPLELRAGFGLSFRAPTFSELYLDQGGITPNPDLQPERAWSADAGVAWRTSSLTLSASVFWSRYREIILYELYPPRRLSPFNAGAARIAGAELQAVLPLPRGFAAEVAYSFLDAVNERKGPQNGHHLPYRPPHRLFARIAHRGDRLEGYFEASYTSRVPRNEYDTAYVPAQVLLNAGAGGRVAGPFWVDVEAKNLLDDRTYEDLFQYPLPGLAIAVIARARL
jgi:iron complex outermembrane receptor protein